MKYLMLLLLPFYSINASAQPHILVKYCLNECVACNLAIHNVINLGAKAPIDVVLLEQSKQDSDAVNSLTEITRNKAKITYSDSLYYKYDSAQRSIVYVIDGNRLLYKSYLKMADKVEIIKILDEHSVGNIDFPNLGLFRQTDSFLYMGGKKGYILRISKRNLDKVFDTLVVINKDLKKDLFKVTYGKDYLKAYDSFFVWAKQGIPNVMEISDFQVSGDTVWVMVSTNTIEKNPTEYLVQMTPYILIYVNNKCIDRIQLDNPGMFYDATGGRYYFTNHFFTVRNGCYYISVYKDSLYDKVDMLAKCKMHAGKLIIDMLVPYTLPEILTKIKVGFMLSQAESSDGIFSNVYSNVLYDLNRDRQIILPDKHKENTFTHQEVLDMTYKEGFMVLSVKLDKNNLSVIMQSGDSLINSRYNYDGKDCRLLSSTLLVHPYPDKQKPTWPMVIDKNRIYNYSWERKKILRNKI